MRVRRAALASILFGMVVAGCGPRYGGVSAEQPRPVALFVGAPGCAGYTALATIPGRGAGTLDPRDAGRAAPHDPAITREARRLGAHAVIDYHQNHELERWVGTAVRFHDPSDDACYRRS